MTALAAARSHAAAPDEGITDTAIRIGVEADVGSLSLDGENQGFKVAFEEANAAGGVHGRRFVWTDRRRRSGDPADVVAVARQMIDDDRVFTLVNFSGPAIGDIAAYARAQRVPLMFPHTALVSSEGERYLFTSFPRFEGEAAVMFRYLAKERGLTRLAIAHDPNAYGTLFRDRLRAHAAELGYTVTGTAAVASRRPPCISQMKPARWAWWLAADNVTAGITPPASHSVSRSIASMKPSRVSPRPAPAMPATTSRPNV